MELLKRPKFGQEEERDVCIIGVSRTPMGNLLGLGSSIEATQLGAIAIKSALSRSKVDANLVEEVIFGNVISAGVGQGPARQAALLAGIPSSSPCTTVNKVCASGMKAVMLASQAIKLGERDIVVVGGMESMSNIPHYLEKTRNGIKYGSFSCIDGMEKDGLQDAFEKVPMGLFAERCATEYGISREEQDQHAAESYKRATNAIKNGKFIQEIVHVDIPGKYGKPCTSFNQDEEPLLRTVNLNTLSKLKPCFKKENGTVTAGNSSPISDGAAALVLASREKAKSLGLTILAVVRGYEDAEQEPEKFCTTPSLAIPKALSRADIKLTDVDYFEINEAFSAVAIANNKILNIDPAKVNIYGGAVALGHPLGCSGARIIVTLCSVLAQENGKIGVASICNGGGGASAIVIERT